MNDHTPLRRYVELLRELEAALGAGHPLVDRLDEVVADLTHWRAGLAVADPSKGAARAATA